MATTTDKVAKLRKDAEVVARGVLIDGQERAREVTAAALELAEKVLVAAQQRVQKLRSQVTKPKA